MKTVSGKKKTGNGTEECVTCPFLFSSACGATHQGQVLLPAAESCHAGAGNVQTKESMWLLGTETSTLLCSEGRKEKPAECGMSPATLCQCVTAVVPMTLTMSVRQHDRRANLQWVEERFNRQETDSAIWDALLGFVYLAL